MATLQETRFIERLQFFNGQRLFAADLQGLEAFNREMRWLHNQSLHQPGVGNGFAVVGNKGDREVVIMPGYALDDLGREIVLPQTHIEPLPPVADDNGKSAVFYLTVSYPDDAELAEVERRTGICVGSGAVRLQEAPIFCWVQLLRDENDAPQLKGELGNDVTLGRKIVLARAEVLNCQLHSALSVAPRRNARPAKQPYIACGSVKVSSKDWTLENPQFVMASEARSLKLTTAKLSTIIKTDDAGFVNIPCYMTNIEGNRIKLGTEKSSFLIDGLISVSDLQPNKFAVEVRLSVLTVSASDSDQLDINLLEIEDPPPKRVNLFSDWKLVWIGVEG